ncbi:MAG: helix-turn-helix transcriptional regulator [Clostridia bacterium]|nr:helix-turn-helix transcriptional regulator [Clostridia bacterium]
MEFNEKLQELRKRKGLTQEQLAESLYVSRTAVSKWESGRGYPNIDSLKRVAEFFSVTIDDLLSDSDTPAEEEKTEPESPPFRRRTFALLDLSAVLLLFLPFFGQVSGEGIRGVSLLTLTGISPLIHGVYFGVLAGMTAAGVLMFLSPSDHVPVRLSLSLNAAGMLVFILSPQPYAAAFLFLLLAVKAFFLIKKP